MVISNQKSLTHLEHCESSVSLLLYAKGGRSTNTWFSELDLQDRCYPDFIVRKEQEDLDIS